MLYSIRSHLLSCKTNRYKLGKGVRRHKQRLFKELSSPNPRQATLSITAFLNSSLFSPIPPKENQSVNPRPASRLHKIAPTTGTNQTPAPRPRPNRLFPGQPSKSLWCQPRSVILLVCSQYPRRQRCGVLSWAIVGHDASDV